MEYDHHEAMKLANQLCFPLYAAARNVTGLYTPWLKPLGLTYTQYIVLLVLWETDGISVSEIGDKLMLDNGTLSPLLKKMEQAGYVERRRCRKDDRIVEVTLTDKGRALQEEAKDIPQKVAGCIDLPEEKAHLLYELLYELLNNQGIDPRQNRRKTEMTTVYDFTVKDRKGNDVSLSDYQGKVLLIVNTATGCGFTPHYEPLEAMYRELRDRGFEILDFPCNQFGHQAPGSDEEIVEFCQMKYNTTFRQFSKIEVNGDNEAPLYTYLKSQKKGGIMGSKIKWNFTKFLVDREGNVVDRYAPTDKPEKIEGDIKKLL